MLSQIMVDVITIYIYIYIVVADVIAILPIVIAI